MAARRLVLVLCLVFALSEPSLRKRAGRGAFNVTASRTKVGNASASVDKVDSMWQLKSGRRMACSDVESPRMKSSLKRFKKVWKAAYKRLESKISQLEGRMHSFSEESHTAEKNIINRIDPTLTDDDKVCGSH